MEIILLEKVANLGNLGDKVSVKPGFARNYLVPHGKAKTATKENLAEFETMRAELESLEADRLKTAQVRFEQLNDKTIIIEHKAGEEGKLFGSVTPNEIEEAVCTQLIKIEKQEIRMSQGSIRAIGEYEIQVSVHSDLVANLLVKVNPIQ